MSRPIAIVVSSYAEFDDQRSRASGNFSTIWFGTCNAMVVELTVDGVINNDITFSMAIDIENGSDDLKYQGVRNGARLTYLGSNTFYICNVNVPTGQKNNFMIKFFPG